jgi:hypothetical protein
MMHETTKLNIEKMNKNYRIATVKGRKEVKLEPGDLVWLHWRTERFLELRKSKLMSSAAGPFKILAKINNNAYKLELPSEFRVSPRINILDLRPYLGEEEEMPSRTMSMQVGEDDEGINTSATIIPSVEILGPITQLRAQQLHHQVNSFLCSSYDIESQLLPNDLIILRNQGEEHGGQTEHQKGVGEPRRCAREGGEPIQFGNAEFESNSESRTTSYSN